jgi:hypothetical protein
MTLIIDVNHYDNKYYGTHRTTSTTPAAIPQCKVIKKYTVIATPTPITNPRTFCGSALCA